jgi:hypothetical protein
VSRFAKTEKLPKIFWNNLKGDSHMIREQSKASILLVEDEENLHDALKLNLELEGYEITSAYDRHDA